MAIGVVAGYLVISLSEFFFFFRVRSLFLRLRWEMPVSFIFRVISILPHFNRKIMIPF